MDSGYLRPGETLDDDYDVLGVLLPGEVIGIMDQLICFEVGLCSFWVSFASNLSDADFRPRQMAWHMGHPLSQSLFSSFYIDKLLWPEPKTPEEARFDREGKTGDENPIVHLVLRAYCVAVIKACGFVYHTICSQHFHEASLIKIFRSQYFQGACADYSAGGRFRKQSVSSEAAPKLRGQRYSESPGSGH